MPSLNRAWIAWKRIGQAVGDFIARVTLIVFYFSVFVPFGLAVRLLLDPFSIGSGHRSFWNSRSESAQNLDEARRLS